MQLKRTPIILMILGLSVPLYSQFTLKGDPLEGRKVFVKKSCVKCHSIFGAGGTLGPDLARLGKRKTFFDMAGLFLGHSPKMIEKIEEEKLEWPTFTPEEMANLFAYLYYINYFDEPGIFEEGKKIFKQSCIQCHSIGGIGGKRWSSLDKYANYMSPVSLAQDMWNKAPVMASEMKKLGIAIPYLKDGDFADILTYIRGMGVWEEFNRKYLSPGDPRKGEKLFKEKYCSTCHTVSGKGGKRGPDLERKGLNKTVSEVAGIMWNHSIEMKAEMEKIGIPFPQFREDELADLIAYLYFIHYFEEKGDSKRGAVLFEEKECIKCHGPANIGPDLTKSSALESPFHFAASMWNHTPIMKTLAEEKLILWPQFKGDDIKDIVTYIKEQRK